MKHPSNKARVARITDFVFDRTQRRFAWTCDGRRVEPNGAEIETALANPMQGLVFALEAAPQGLPQRLHVFAADGTELVTLGPPERFQFYYLTEHLKFGVTVVCVTDEPINGWQDWQFSFDPETRQLVRQSPSR